MENQYSRTELLLGSEGVSRLKNAKVIIFGIGGVGGYTAEALARAGVGSLSLVDSDTVSVSNINRQIIATHKTVGKYKTEAMKERIREINPDIEVKVYNTFYDEENSGSFDFSEYDYVVDAIDSVRSKIELICQAKRQGARIISSMGAGNKLDPCAFSVSDISKSSVCPLARAVRTELNRRNITNVKCVFSKELPVKKKNGEDGGAPGSVSFVPSVAGLIIAGEVIKDIAEIKNNI